GQTGHHLGNCLQFHSTKLAALQRTRPAFSPNQSHSARQDDRKYRYSGLRPAIGGGTKSRQPLTVIRSAVEGFRCVSFKVTSTVSLGPSRTGIFARDRELKAKETATRTGSLAFWHWRCESRSWSRALRWRVFQPAARPRRERVK